MKTEMTTGSSFVWFMVGLGSVVGIILAYELWSAYRRKSTRCIFVHGCSRCPCVDKCNVPGRQAYIDGQPDECPLPIVEA